MITRENLVEHKGLSAKTGRWWDGLRLDVKKSIIDSDDFLRVNLSPGLKYVQLSTSEKVILVNFYVDKFDKNGLRRR